MKPIPARAMDLRGKVFGRLTVLEYAGKAENSRHSLWLVRCSCEKKTEKKIEGYVLTRGHALSCGCYRDEQVSKANTTHGMWKTPEYEAWHSILQRTENPNNKSYHRYGGRGIKMWELWKTDFHAFLEHIKLRPSPLHSLDRLDNNKGYVPGNLAWRTKKQQQRNRSTNKLILHNGENLTAAEWGERIGVSDCTIWARIRIWKWSIEKAVTTPSNRKNKKPTPIKEWAGAGCCL